MEYSRRGDEMLKFPFHMNPEVEIFLIFSLSVRSGDSSLISFQT